MSNSERNPQIIVVENLSGSRIGILKLGLVVGQIIFNVLKMVHVLTCCLFRYIFPIAEKPVDAETVLITGGASGIGKQLALQYAALGATVVCWDILKDNGQRIIEEIALLGYPKAYFYECDVSNQSSVMETAKKVQQEVGNVTILVNNVGIAYAKTVLQVTPSEIKKTMDVNVLSQFWTIQAFLPSMLENNHGHIVAMSSVAGLSAGKNGTSYCASKFAVRGIMEALYQELRQTSNCRVKSTIVYPSIVKTDFFKHAYVGFPIMTPILEAQDVAKEVISAQRKDIFELSIPRRVFAVLSFGWLFPISVYNIVYDLLNLDFETY